MHSGSDSPDDAGSHDSLAESLPARTLRQIGRHLNGDDRSCDSILAVWAAGRELRLDLQRVLRPLGLSDVKFGTLLSLYALAPEPANPVDLAYHAGATRSSMTDVLDQLEACSWVRRERVADDRRMIHVTLTADGRAQVEKALAVFFQEVSALSSGLTPEQKTSLEQGCASLTRVLVGRLPLHSPSA